MRVVDPQGLDPARCADPVDVALEPHAQGRTVVPGQARSLTGQAIREHGPGVDSERCTTGEHMLPTTGLAPVGNLPFGRGHHGRDQGQDGRAVGVGLAALGIGQHGRSVVGDGLIGLVRPHLLAHAVGVDHCVNRLDRDVAHDISLRDSGAPPGRCGLSAPTR